MSGFSVCQSSFVLVPVDGVAPSFRVYESLVLLLNYTGAKLLYYNTSYSQKLMFRLLKRNSKKPAGAGCEGSRENTYFIAP